MTAGLTGRSCGPSTGARLCPQAALIQLSIDTDLELRCEAWSGKRAANDLIPWRIDKVQVRGIIGALSLNINIVAASAAVGLNFRTSLGRALHPYCRPVSTIVLVDVKVLNLFSKSLMTLSTLALS